MHRDRLIQDVFFLYELSLAVGYSLDARENCRKFVSVLTSRKNLNYAAVWIRENGAREEAPLQLLYALPAHRTEAKTLPADHFIVRRLAEAPSFTIDHADPGFQHCVQEKNIESGSYACFRLGAIGVLKLYSSGRAQGFTEVEIAQLAGVIEKFTVSLEGCLAHEKLAEETEQRRQVQAQLEQTNHRLSDLFENMYDALLRIAPNGDIIEANRAAKLLLGYTPEDTLQLNIKSVIHPEDYERAQSYLQRLLDVGFYSDYEGRILTRQGKVRYVQVNSNAIFEGGAFAGSRDIVRDITDRKKAELELRNSEEKYRGIIENMELGLMEVDRNGRVVRAYERFCVMTGYRPEELIGKDANAVFLTEEARRIMAQQEADRLAGQAGVYEIPILHKNGHPLWVLISGAPIYNNRGEITGSIGIHYDLTERKQLEEDLASAKRAAEKAQLAEQQFLANMSHEIRTPMNAVIGMTHLLGDTPLNAEQKEYLDALRFSADALLGLINNILDLSKIGAGELELEHRSFQLSELLEGLRTTFQYKLRDKPIRFVADFDPAVRHLIRGDSVRLNQILTNLLGNAVKFTEAGTIGLSTRVVESSPARYTIAFRVFDTGIGIEKDKLDSVFENFKQASVKVARKFGGTGLGLTIVKQLVTLMGGRLKVESEAGLGSQFTATLSFENTGEPVTQPNAVKPAATTHSDELVGGLFVLVVEDNPMNQKLISRILDKWACRYHIAETGERGLEWMRTHVFDLILMDIHLPGIDGVGATQAIRRDAFNPNRQTPIIALTAAALLEEKNRALRAGMNDFLTKPFSPTLLAKTIRKNLGLSGDAQPRQGAAHPSKAVPGRTIDLSYLQEISGGDPFFVQKMVETFIEDATLAIRQLREALLQEDWETLQRTAHSMKPNLHMMGLHDQKEGAIRLEAALREKETRAEILHPLVETLARKTEAVLPVLREQVGGHADN